VPFAADGQPRLLLMVNDISDRIRAEAELARNRDRLEELVEERTRELKVAQQELIKRERLTVLGQLTATVSHELRNPLGVINSSTFYLQQNLPGADEKIAKHLTRINEQVNICDTIVGDLLEYTRDRHLEKVNREINPWLKQLLDDFFGSEKVKVIYELSADVPKISFDREKMRRVMVNIVSNALQAVSAKQKLAKTKDVRYEPRVSLSTHRKENRIVIRVEDNGVGMDEETRKRAFEPLFTTRARGTGLGLAIVEKIVTQHEGTVSLETRLDEGTTVTVVLPINF
jgi:signal transduction histidine kinase